MVPCFQEGCSGFTRTTGAGDSEATQTAEISYVLPATSEAPKSTRGRRPRSPTALKSCRARGGRPSSSPHRPNHCGSPIRKIHEAHRGGFRRNPRVQLLQKAVANEIRIPVNPVMVKDRPLLLPSPLKQCDNASNSQQPVASNVHGTPSTSSRQHISKVNNQSSPPRFAGTGSSSSSPPESTTHVQEPAVLPSQIDCDCLPSALRLLEELETRNHHMQDYTGATISQHLSSFLGKCVGMLECKRCVELSEQMMLMIIIAQKVTKMFSRLATRFTEQDQSMLSAETSIPLPRLVLIQQLRLERVLNHLAVISRNRNWQTHLAMLEPTSQHSKDIMDRLRLMNRLHNTSNSVSSNEDNTIGLSIRRVL